MKKVCINCNKLKEYVFYRKINEEKILLCSSCYRKCLDVCSLCHKHRKTYTYSTKNKPICKKCFIEKEKNCKQCQKNIPAGKGNICDDCLLSNLLIKKILSYTALLSKYTNYLFEEFCYWLKKRRNIHYTALFIDKYFFCFSKIDYLCLKIKKIPNYEILLYFLDKSLNKRYYLVLLFLHENNNICINIKTKEFYSNLNTIISYKNTFIKNSKEYITINRYLTFLYSKYTSNKISFRTIRLSLTPAIKLLTYRKEYNFINLNDDVVESYLWIYPGQTSSLTGFINFLNKSFHYKLKKIKATKKRALYRSTKNKTLLKNKIIKLLKSKDLSKIDISNLIKISIEYFHRIHIPKNVFLTRKNILKDNETIYIYAHSYKFYIPNEIVYKII